MQREAAQHFCSVRTVYVEFLKSVSDVKLVLNTTEEPCTTYPHTQPSSQATPALLAKATNMKVIGRAGVGIDNIDVAEATRKGVLVMNTPGGNTVSTAQLAISLLCSAAR